MYKYIGYIGEEREGTFNTYHFDYRGSTVAITNENCVVTDRFEYDTYGRLTYRTGSTDVIFMYNGRDGVISDTNGLIYMRARYYSTSFLRFINADILHGNISDSTSLNRYAYVNGNPVSFVDPFGLAAEGRNDSLQMEWDSINDKFALEYSLDQVLSDELRKIFYDIFKLDIDNSVRPNNIGKGTWAKQIEERLKWIEKTFGETSKYASFLNNIAKLGTVIDIGAGVLENAINDIGWPRIISDVLADTAYNLGLGTLNGLVVKGTTALGTLISPGLGTAIGFLVGTGVGFGTSALTEKALIEGKTTREWIRNGVAYGLERLGNGIIGLGKQIKSAASWTGDKIEKGIDWLSDSYNWLEEKISSAFN